jgi:ATP-binding protein involved in chromosome partitioning
MNAISEQQIKDALKGLTDPNTGKDYVSTRKARRTSRSTGDKVSLDIELGYPAKSQIEDPQRRGSTAARVPGVGSVTANVTQDRRACGAARREADSRRPQHHRRGLGQGRRRQVHHAVNLALALAAEGAKRRHARRRHLRPVAAADAGHQRQAGVARTASRSSR